uniref:DUF148 domain-containing protein n=1 Tax=Steinernema glaseri TaxID=37863 RepID=A0A1I8AUK8_9BILA
MWIHSTLAFILLFLVISGWAGYARPPIGTQSKLRHSKKQQEKLDNILNNLPKGADLQPLKGIDLMKQRGAKIFIKNGQDVTNLDQIKALLDANKGALNQKVQQQQAAIYQQHKNKIDSLKASAQNLNAKPRRDDDGQLSIHDINSAVGMTGLLHEGDMAFST